MTPPLRRYGRSVFGANAVGWLDEDEDDDDDDDDDQRFQHDMRAAPSKLFCILLCFLFQ